MMVVVFPHPGSPVKKIREGGMALAEKVVAFNS